MHVYCSVFQYLQAYEVVMNHVILSSNPWDYLHEEVHSDVLILVRVLQIQLARLATTRRDSSRDAQADK